VLIIRQELIWILGAFWLIGIAKAEEDRKTIIYWDTVSPNGKYALAWTKSGAINRDDMPYPDDKDGGVQNWLIELDSRRLVLLIPNTYYWTLPDGSRPNHYSMETVWSDDSLNLAIVLNSRWETEEIFLVNSKSAQVKEVTDKVLSAFKQVLRREGGSGYNRHATDYVYAFDSPWFLNGNRFEIRASADIPKTGSDYFTYAMTFGLSSGSATFEKAAVSDSTGEPGDRQLNRIYRSLIPILQPAEREALIKEERAWILQRDATKGSDAKEKVVQDRIGELSDRVARKVAELNSEEGEGGGVNGQR
jgi:hypothetical protein